MVLPISRCFCTKVSVSNTDREIAHEIERCIRAFVDQQKGEIVELNVQIDHVHLLAMIPPKVSISNFVGTLKGRTAIRIFNKFRKLKNRPYWGNHFWSRGYCVDTVGLDADKAICKVSGKRGSKTREARATVLKQN